MSSRPEMFGKLMNNEHVHQQVLQSSLSIIQDEERLCLKEAT